MTVNSTAIRTWSILGQRGTFGTALSELANSDERIIALSADLCNTSGLDRFRQSHPDRFINTGIAEQNLVGVAAGIADSGAIPFASTFANFVALRACEPVRHFMGYMKCNVKMVGLGAGYAMELFGNTHYGIEDIAAIRSISNLCILSPADGLEVVNCIKAAAENQLPTYIRLTGVMNHPIVYSKEYDFKIGRAVPLREGGDIAIFATGSMVYRAKNAAEILQEAGIECALYDMHTIKPIDMQAIKENYGRKLIVSVEEHSVTGGLGTAIAEILSETPFTPPLLKLGIKQAYPKAGDYDYMLLQAGLTATKIAETIKEKYLEVCK